MTKHKMYFTRKVYDGSNLDIPLTAEFDSEFRSWKSYIEELWKYGYSVEEAIEDINHKLKGIPTWDWDAARRAN